jgi:hypothetical protein
MVFDDNSITTHDLFLGMGQNFYAFDDMILEHLCGLY